MKISGLSVLLVVLWGCAGVESRLGAGPSAFDLIITDQPLRQSFEVRLTSRVDFPFCIDADAWPNSLGQVAAGSQLIRLHSESGDAFAKGGYAEYCLGGCEVFVPARGTVIGHVNYSAFGDPLWVASLPNRTLYLDVRPARCNHDHR